MKDAWDTEKDILSERAQMSDIGRELLILSYLKIKNLKEKLPENCASTSYPKSDILSPCIPQYSSLSVCILLYDSNLWLKQARVFLS